MKLDVYLKQVEKFLQEYLETTKCSGYVLGVSGGIDSSAVLAITLKAVGKEKIHCLIMPCLSNPADKEDAIKLCKHFGVAYDIVDLSNTYNTIASTLEVNNKFSQLSMINVKVRLRMVTLYAYAQNMNRLVLGTDNLDESYVGYFTKYGDGGVDLLPIKHLVKREVREAARLYNVPEYLVNRIPTAGLFEGQTDETELKVTYDQLDDYLLGKEIPQPAKERIEYLHKVSQHKRDEIPSPKMYCRDEE